MIVHRPDSDERRYGSVVAPNTFHVYLQSGSRWRTQRMQHMQVACAVVHEMVHCKRMEHEPFDSLFELAATEGLAYNTEYLFRRNLAPWYRVNGVVNKIKAMPNEELLNMKGQFMNAEDTRGAISQESWNEWYAAHLYLMCKPEIIGIDAVTRQLASGKQLAELIVLPATVLLDVD